MAKNDLLIRIGAKADAYFREMKKINDKQRDITEGLTRVGQVSGIAFAALAVNAGIAAKKFIDFDAGMRNFNTIAKLNETQLEGMSEKLLDISRTYPQTAQTLTEGLYQVVSAGIDSADAMEVLESAAIAATAGMSNTNTAVTAIAGTLNAYGLEAKEAGYISDVMFKTVERGMVTFPELAQNIGQVNAVAATAGVEFPEVAAAMATLTKNGINASEAQTALRGTILGIIKPGDEMKRVFKELGVESGEALLREKGLAGALQDIASISGTSATELSKVIVEKRAFTGAAILAGKGASDFANDLKEMNNASGSAQKAFDEQSKTLKIAIAQMKSSLDALYISIGKDLEPAITKTVKAMTVFFDKMSELNQATGGLVSGVLTAGMAFTGLVSGLSFASVGVIKFSGIIKSSTALTKLWGVALKALPFVAVAVAVAALRDKLIDLGEQIVDQNAENKKMEASNLGIIAAHRKRIRELKELGDEEVKEAGRMMKASDAIKIYEGAIELLTKKEMIEINKRKEAREEANTEIIEKEQIQAQKIKEIEIEKQELLAQIQEDTEMTNAEKRSYYKQLEEDDERQLAENILDIKAQLADKEEALNKQRYQNAISGTAQMFGNLSSLMASENKKMFEIGKAAAVAETIINTYSSAQKAFNALVGVPVVGPALAVAAATAATVAGIMRVDEISNTQFNPAGAQEGVFDFRAPGNNEKLVTTLAPGESIIPKSFTDAMKEGKASMGGGITVNVNVKEFYGSREYVKMIAEGARKGIQMGYIKSGAFTGATS